jgi:hypothetical protein
MNKVYRDNTPAQNMSIDGWSRGFRIEQTLNEMTAMGVEITREQIRTHWEKLDKGFLGA